MLSHQQHEDCMRELQTGVKLKCVARAGLQGALEVQLGPQEV